VIIAFGLFGLLVASFCLARYHGGRSLWRALFLAFGPGLILALLVAAILIAIGYLIESNTDIESTSATLFQLQEAVDRAQEITDVISLKGWKIIVGVVVLTALAILFGVQRVQPLFHFTARWSAGITLCHFFFVLLSSFTYFGTDHVAVPLVDRELRLRNVIEEQGQILGSAVTEASRQFVQAVAGEACNVRTTDSDSICDSTKVAQNDILDIDRIRHQALFSSTSFEQLCSGIVSDDSQDSKNLVNSLCASHARPTSSGTVLPAANWLEPSVRAVKGDMRPEQIGRVSRQVSGVPRSTSPADVLTESYIENAYDLTSDEIPITKGAIKVFSGATGIPEELADALFDITLNEQIKKIAVDTARRLLPDWLSEKQSFSAILRDFRITMADAMRSNSIVTEVVARATASAAKMHHAASLIRARWAQLPDGDFARRATAIQDRLFEVLKAEHGVGNAEIERYARALVRDNVAGTSDAEREKKLHSLESEVQKLNAGDHQQRLRSLYLISLGSAATMPDGIIRCKCGNTGPTIMCFRSQIGQPCG
jgi:hypothetical protein